MTTIFSKTDNTLCLMLDFSSPGLLVDFVGYVVGVLLEIRSAKFADGSEHLLMNASLDVFGIMEANMLLFAEFDKLSSVFTFHVVNRTNEGRQILVDTSQQRIYQETNI